MKCAAGSCTGIRVQTSQWILKLTVINASPRKGRCVLDSQHVKKQRPLCHTLNTGAFIIFYLFCDSTRYSIQMSVWRGELPCWGL